VDKARKSNFGQVLVVVLNPSLIPTELYVVIGDHYFELGFEVEKWGLMRMVRRRPLSGRMVV
jgi:hypothetical protein